jgi:hypothetical protein
MLSFQTLFLNEPCSDELRQSTRNSIVFSSAENLSLVECEQSRVFGAVDISSAEVIHVVMPGTILMPEFYRAMLTVIEHMDRDYAICHELVLPLKSVIGIGDASYDCSQFMIRRWVYQEIGAVGSMADLIGKVTGEYRGCEVPHVLCVRC